MPSALHETLIQLFRQEPVFVQQIVNNTAGVGIGPFTTARVTSENATVIQPTERRVDATIELSNEPGMERMAVIVEVQLKPDQSKNRSWPTYVCRLREDMDCPIALLVICIDNRTAKWAASPIKLGPAGTITPIAIGPKSVPRIIDPQDPDATAEMAVLSVIMHGNERGSHEIIDAMDAVFAGIDPARAADYTDYAMGLLQASPRAYLEALMKTETRPYHSEFAGRFYREGEAKGEARGEAKMLLTMLGHLRIDVPDAARERIMACTDSPTLERWAARAATARTIQDILD